ncbi:protein kinase domain-containing protein (plasmid) [Paenibacillus sp. S-38]|uniref:protein kinase domain-containing protein n=1 Tax=Paenibacillus sp. S-38 TaxID=3416710 RepID=UPI003CE8AC9D
MDDQQLVADEHTLYLENKINELTSKFNGDDHIAVFAHLYRHVPNEQQRTLFSLLHYHLNDLLGYMYNRGAGNRYTAHESRQLMYLIRLIDLVRPFLDGTQYQFTVEPSYNALLELCKTFLRMTEGSPIPNDLPIIALVDYKPIFHITDSFTVTSSPMVAYPLRHIGSGSYANVYKYTDKQYNLPVIVKRAKSNLTPEELTRFRNEFEILKKLDSPFIIKAYEFNEHKMEFSMECADETLDKYITRMNDRLPMVERIRLITQLLRAFEYIHKTGLLHRDISYSNILVKTHADGTVFLKISDFGLAKHPGSSLTRQGTQIKGVLNDPSLASTGFENFEQRHDIYALTFVINFILTGRKNLVTVTDKEVRGFIDQGIDADITKRYANVVEMTAAFQRIIPTLRQTSIKL